MWARGLGAVVVAAAGTGSFAALIGISPGLAAGKPLTLGLLVLQSTAFWITFAVIAAIAATILRPWTTARRPEPSGRLPNGSAWTRAEPCFWGLGAPLVSLLIDPWSFHRTAYITGFVGLALGILGVLARLRDDGVRASLSERQAVVLLAGLAVLIPTLLVLPGPPWFHPISGDEPHYLVTARSLWVDGDVDLANEYSEGLTRPFWSSELSAHAKPGADPSARYSIHGTGLPMWLAPWYGLGQDMSEEGFGVLVRVAMSLWLAAATVALFFLLRAIIGFQVALSGTFVAVFTLPLLFAGPHLFPAVPVFALSCGAYVLLREPTPGRAFAAGLMLAYLPWLHFKFSAVAAVIAAFGLWSIYRTYSARSAQRGAARGDTSSARLGAVLGDRRSIFLCAALAAPLALSAIAHMAFTWALYGRLSPLAIHVGADSSLRATAAGDDWRAYFADPGGALRTGIGYFLDQREGLLFYAPHYLLAIAGAAWLWRRRRADAVALLLILASLAGPYALSQEIGHWAPPARPLTGVLWTLAVAMAVGLALPAGNGTAARPRAALRAVLLTYGAGATVLLLLQADLLYHDYNVGRALVLLRYGAPGLPLAEMAPLWLGPDAMLWTSSAIGLAVVAALSVFLWRWGRDAADASLTGTDYSPYPGPTATRAAAVFVIFAAALMLLHHARVPLTDLHQSWTYETIRFWKPQSPPTRAWGEPEGLWTGGFDDVELLLSSPRPLGQVVLEVETLAPMLATIQLGSDRQQVHVAPGERTLARLNPGPATRWGNEYFYHLMVSSPGGASRSALGLGDDSRGLGTLLRVLDSN